MEYDDTCILTK